MGETQIEGVILEKKQILDFSEGSIMHILNSTDEVFDDFGEAYFSSIKPGIIKGWKKHKKMILNLVVLVGEIRFVIHDNRSKSVTNGKFMDFNLSRNNYQRLTLMPGLWFAFECISSEESILLNIANIKHDDSEIERRELDKIKYFNN